MNRTKALFNRWASEGDDKRAESEHSFAVFKVLDSLKWENGDSYLDIGCGNGYTLRHVSRRFKKGSLTGIDFSEKMIANAGKLSGRSARARFVLGDFTKFDFGKRRFDKIFSMEAFYYFKNVPAAVRKARRLLNQGGVFACVVDFYAENKASHKWPKPCCCNVPMKMYSRSGWRTLFKKAGFDDIEQYQIKYPKKLAKEDWQVKFGSLVTVGRRRNTYVR